MRKVILAFLILPLFFTSCQQVGEADVEPPKTRAAETYPAYMVDLSNMGIKFSSSKTHVGLGGGYAVSGTFTQKPNMSEQEIKSQIQSKIYSSGVSGVTVDRVGNELTIYLEYRVTPIHLFFKGEHDDNYFYVTQGEGSSFIYISGYSANSSPTKFYVPAVGGTVQITVHTGVPWAAKELVQPWLGPISWITADSGTSWLWLTFAPYTAGNNSSRFVTILSSNGGSIEIEQTPN